MHVLLHFFNDFNENVDISIEKAYVSMKMSRFPIENQSFCHLASAAGRGAGERFLKKKKKKKKNFFFFFFFFFFGNLPAALPAKRLDIDNAALPAKRLDIDNILKLHM